MRITDLKASLATTQVPINSRDSSKGNMPALVLQIFTDSGITGSFLAWERMSTNRGLAETLVDAVKPFLVGKDPFDRELIWQTLTSWNRRGLPMIGTGAVDVCLWDIAGKALGVPIYQLMGAYRDKLRAYASTGIMKKPEDYQDLAMQLKAQGYTAIKIHVKGEPQWDVEACKALRAGAPNLDLMLDSSCYYTRQEALWVGRELEKLNFYWYESPLPDTDIEGLTELTRMLDIPIAGTEYLYECNSTHFAPYVRQHVVDIVRTDARRSITLAKKVSDMCAAFDVNCELHSKGSLLSQVANLHVMGAIKNCEFFEHPEPIAPYEFCGKDHLRIDSEGYMHMPTKPGMGVDLDWDEVDKCTIFEA